MTYQCGKCGGDVHYTRIADDGMLNETWVCSPCRHTTFLGRPLQASARPQPAPLDPFDDCIAQAASAVDNARHQLQKAERSAADAQELLRVQKIREKAEKLTRMVADLMRKP